jgi:mono/diheme cytochrome c family protein
VDTQAVERGAAIYAGACASCHDMGRQVLGGALELSLSTSVAMPAPGNLIRIIREGFVPADGEKGPWMPGFAGALTDRQLTDLVIYLRAHVGEKPAWDGVAGEVEKAARNKSRE